MPKFVLRPVTVRNEEKVQCCARPATRLPLGWGNIRFACRVCTCRNSLSLLIFTCTATRTHQLYKLLYSIRMRVAASSDKSLRLLLFHTKLKNEKKSSMQEKLSGLAEVCSNQRLLDLILIWSWFDPDLILIRSWSWDQRPLIRSWRLVAQQLCLNLIRD